MGQESVFQNPLQQLDGIDLLILRRHYRDAAHAFFRLLNSLAKEWSQTSFSRVDHHGDENHAVGEICERAARQWYQILASDCDMTKLDYTLYVSNIGIMHAVLMGTSTGNLDDFIGALHRKTGGNYSTADFLRAVLAWCPNSRVGFDVFSHYRHAPELVFAHAIGCIGGIGLVSEGAGEHRNKAIDFLIANKGMNIDKLVTVSFSAGVLDAWMRCSYAEHPKRHEVKRLLNRMIRQASEIALDSGNVALPAISTEANGRKVLVVPLESFRGNHAMFRCYANILQECRKHFFTIGMCARGLYDEKTTELFDQFVDVSEISDAGENDENVNLNAIKRVVKLFQPDLIYYPSVGMSLWVVALANQRLAPAQVMSFGHPASSFSSVMDYAIVEDAWSEGCDDLCSEKIIRVPDRSAVFKLPDAVVRVDPIDRLPPDGIIRIAVPSVSQKLTSGFIRCLRRVEEAVPGKVHFVFFAGTRSVFYSATVQSLRRQLKSLECFGMLSYEDYIAQINRCQIHAGTFPFGGTNSLVDSLRQGLPIVSMLGSEVHSQIDASFSRRIGLPDYLACHSEDEYVATLVGLVNNPARLLALKRYLIHEAEVDKAFLQDGRPECYAEALRDLVAGGEKA
ncbi:MAG: hypothetical protein ACK4SX_05680 [Alcanivoracaceae bacterium]